MLPTKTESIQLTHEAGPPEYGDETELALNGVTRVLIGGFDNAGKSTLACSLYRSLNGMGVEAAVYELDRWSDTHDVILGKKLPHERQKTSHVSREMYRTHADKFVADTSKIVIGDLEGRYQSSYIPILRRSADFGVLVTRPPIEKDEDSDWLQTEEGWRKLFETLEVPISYHIHSIASEQPHPAGTEPVFGLERKLVPDNPGVIKLAEFILEYAGVN